MISSKSLLQVSQWYVRAVSYTHLDVYKRQVYRYTFHFQNRAGELSTFIFCQFYGLSEPFWEGSDGYICPVSYTHLELHEAYLKKAKEGEEIIRQIERDIALILEAVSYTHLDVYKRQHMEQEGLILNQEI